MNEAINKEMNEEMNEEYRGKAGETLRLAVERGDIGKVRECITSSVACINDPDRDCDFTPLHYAAIRTHYDIAKLLLENGADVTAPARGQYHTPLHYLYHFRKASIDKKLPVMKLLLNYGAASKLNNKNSSDRDSTILHHAAEKGDLKATRLFIKHGSDVNATDRSGKTPLHCAIIALQRSNEVKEWIERQKKLKSNDGNSSDNNNDNYCNNDRDDCHNDNNCNHDPKDYGNILKSKYMKTIKLLLKSGADSTLCSQRQGSDLMAALDTMYLYCNCHKIVGLLKSKGLI